MTVSISHSQLNNLAAVKFDHMPKPARAQLFIGDIFQWNELLQQYRIMNPRRSMDMGGIDFTHVAAQQAQKRFRAIQTMSCGSLQTVATRDLVGVSFNQSNLTGITVPDSDSGKKLHIRQLSHLANCEGVLVIAAGNHIVEAAPRVKSTADITDIVPGPFDPCYVKPPSQEPVRILSYNLKRNFVIIDAEKKLAFFEAQPKSVACEDEGKSNVFELTRLRLGNLDSHTLQAMHTIANDAARKDDRWLAIATKLAARLVTKRPELFSTNPYQLRKPTTGSALTMPLRAAAAPA